MTYKPGYYWAKFTKFSDWEIVEYSGGGLWYKMGSDESFVESEFMLIENERINHG